MWHLFAAGTLTAGLLIDACTTLTLVVLSVMIVASSGPNGDTLGPSKKSFSSSARRAETVGGREDTLEMEGKDETASPSREMVTNPRRPVAKPSTTEVTSAVETPPAFSRSAFVGARSREAHLRLMQAMRNDMMNARIHQFEHPRVTTKPTS